MTRNGLNAAPASPVSDSVAEPSAPPIDWTEVEHKLEAAPGSAAVSTPDAGPASVEGPVDDVQASLHEQLAALVEALAFDDKSEPKSEDTFELSGLPDVLEQSRLVEAESEAAVAQQDDQQTESDTVPPAIINNVLSRRLFGFFVGLIGSAAVGGGMLIFFVGMNEPAAIAGNEASKLEARLIDITAEPVRTVQVPLEQRIPHAFGIEPKAAVGGEEGPAEASAIRSESVARPETDVAGAAQVEPRLAADESHSEPVSSKPLQTADGAPALKSLEQANDDAGQQSLEKVSSFETVINPPIDERDQASPPVAGKSTTKQKQIEDPVTQTRVARVIKYVNMRAGPDNSEEVLAVIPEGSSVEVVQCTQWCEVIFAGQRGWIYKGLMTVASTNEVTVRYN